MDKRLKHLNALRSFECAARHQSYSKAAKELFVSQAAISQQMRQLEQSIGIKLFVRNGRKMDLTQSGEKLYLSTNQAFTILVKGLNDIQSEGIAGNLTITSTHSYCALWLMPRLYKFSRLHPDINVKIVGSNHLENLTQSHIDLAIRFSDLKDKQLETKSGLTFVDLGQASVYPVCSPNLVKHMALDKPVDILKCWLVNIANSGRLGWTTWFKAAKVENYQDHKMWSEVSSGDLALSAVLSGHGVAMLSEDLFSNYIDVGSLVIPFDIEHPESFKRSLVFDPNSMKLARIDAFVQWMKAEHHDVL